MSKEETCDVAALFAAPRVSRVPVARLLAPVDLLLVNSLLPLTTDVYQET